MALHHMESPAESEEEHAVDPPVAVPFDPPTTDEHAPPPGPTSLTSNIEMAADPFSRMSPSVREAFRAAEDRFLGFDRAARAFSEPDPLESHDDVS